MIDPAADARMELARRKLFEASRYWTPCGEMESYLLKLNQATNTNKLYISNLNAGNGGGKTALSIILADYLSQHIPNPYLDQVSFLKNFKRPARGRIITTQNAAQNNYQSEILKWLPRNRFSSHQDGRSFPRRFSYRNGSEWDIFTHEQDPEQLESLTLDWAAIDEPISRKLWTALVSRFRFGGVIFIHMTPLYDAGWMRDELETDIARDDVFITRMSSEAACKTHGVRGHLPHEYIETLTRNSDADELTARLEGNYLSLSGLVFKSARRDVHVKQFDPYHQAAWDRGEYTLYQIMDPHDRKPFAIGWFAVFPNDDVYCIAEYPGDRLFHKMTSSSLSCADYARIIKKTEEAIGKPADLRLIDPNFGNAPKLGTKTVKQEMAEHGLYYLDPPDQIHEGHIAVKSLLGNHTSGVRSKLYFLPHVQNHIFALFHYAWKEKKNERAGMSEDPELIYKDFADLIRYGALYGFKYRKKNDEVILFKPRDKGYGYRGY